MIPSGNALDLIKRFEGCILEAYQDAAGVWTIGWGTTGVGIVEGLVISQATADAMLLGHIREVGLDLTDMFANQLKQNQFDALTSFVYNIGFNAFKQSTMCRLLKAKQYADAANEFPRWNHCAGQVLPGLTARREAEQSLFLS